MKQQQQTSLPDFLKGKSPQETLDNLTITLSQMLDAVTYYGDNSRFDAEMIRVCYHILHGLRSLREELIRPQRE